MATYTRLTDDEKAAIAQGEIRSLEYQMYTLELKLIAENAKSSPDETSISDLTTLISEKQTQIAAIQQGE
jgi:hypothetical protein